MAVSVRFEDLELLEAVRDFTLDHDHPDIARFKPAMRDWGDSWRALPPAYHPAADFLDAAARQPDSHELVARFAIHKHRLRWEQSYRREDGLVAQAMLDGYAFTEVVGKHGPFVSERIRCGIAVWGPGIDYPRHHHEAEEAYLVLAGAAEFDLAGAEPALRGVTEVVHVPSNTPHGLRTRDALLVVFYLWQDGDLRQQSSFE